MTIGLMIGLKPLIVDILPIGGLKHQILMTTLF
jgi:hypothetical protein